MLSFIQRYALLMSGVAVMALASPLAFAATTGGLDTPVGIQTLPLAVEGNAVITLTDKPNAAAVNGTLQIDSLSGCAAGSTIIMNADKTLGCTTPSSAQPLFVKITGNIIGATAINKIMEKGITNLNLDSGDASFYRNACEAPTSIGQTGQFTNEYCQNVFCAGATGNYPALTHLEGNCDAPNSPDPNSVCSVNLYNDQPVIDLACMQTTP